MIIGNTNIELIVFGSVLIIVGILAAINKIVNIIHFKIMGFKTKATITEIEFEGGRKASVREDEFAIKRGLKLKKDGLHITYEANGKNITKNIHYYKSSMTIGGKIKICVSKIDPQRMMVRGIADYVVISILIGVGILLCKVATTAQ